MKENMEEKINTGRMDEDDMENLQEELIFYKRKLKEAEENNGKLKKEYLLKKMELRKLQVKLEGYERREQEDARKEEVFASVEQPEEEEDVAEFTAGLIERLKNES